MTYLIYRMSASAAVLTSEEYEQRKIFSEEVKLLTKNEMEEIYRILKAAAAEYSENSNGVFFDVSKLPAEIFGELQKFMVFCKKNRDEFTAREEEYRKAQDALVNGMN
jgi:hypothetical protein